MTYPSEEEIKKLAKRLVKPCQDLEVEGMDIVLYCKALSQSKMPVKYIDSVTKVLEASHAEIGRITKTWKEMFIDITGSIK